MYGSNSQQQQTPHEHQRLLPSYSPAGARLEHSGSGRRDGHAHVASSWPATFEEGVET